MSLSKILNGHPIPTSIPLAYVPQLKLPVPLTEGKLNVCVTQRALAPIHIRRVTQMHGARSEGRTWLCYTARC